MLLGIRHLFGQILSLNKDQWLSSSWSPPQARENITQQLQSFNGESLDKCFL